MMDAAERKRLIAKGKDNAKIAEAIAEEKRILANKPVHRMTPDPRLKHLPKHADPKKPGELCAVDVLNEKRERMAAGVALMSGASVKEAPKKEAPKAEKPKVEKPKTESKGRRSTKVK